MVNYSDFVIGFIGSGGIDDGWSKLLQGSSKDNQHRKTNKH